MITDLLGHLFPAFDTWWPNIIASVVWGTPAFTAQHVLLRRAHRRALNAHSVTMRAELAAHATDIREHVTAAHTELAIALKPKTRPRPPRPAGKQ